MQQNQTRTCRTARANALKASLFPGTTALSPKKTIMQIAGAIIIPVSLIWRDRENSTAETKRPVFLRELAKCIIAHAEHIARANAGTSSITETQRPKASGNAAKKNNKTA